MMKNRATLILIAVFLGGLGLLWSLEGRRGRVRPDRENLLVSTLTGMSDGDLKAIELSGGTKRLRFERRGDDWQMVQPVDVLADRSMLNALIATVRSLSDHSEAGDIAGPAAAYGLEPPLRTVTLIPSEPSAPPIRIKIGEVRNGFVYLRVNDDPAIHVADAPGLNSWSTTLDSWRARTVFPVPAHEVERVAFLENGRTFALVHGVGTWKITAPFSAPADDPKTEGLVAALIGLRVASERGFVTDEAKDLKPFGLDPPRLRIDMTSGLKTPIVRSLRLGNPIPHRPGFAYALFGDQDDVVAVDRTGIPPFDTLALSLRNTEVADVDFDRATELRVQAGHLTYVLTRDADDWKQRTPVAVAGDTRLILEYLAHLGGLHAVKIVPANQVEQTGLEHPSAIIQVWHGALGQAASGPADMTLKLGRFDVPRQVLYAQAAGEPNVLSLPASARTLIPDTPLAFAERQIHTFPSDSIARIEVQRGDRSVTLRASDQPRDHEHWSMTEPVKAAVDAQTVLSLDTVLSNLRATSLLPEGDPAAAGLNPPWLEIRWVLRDGAKGSLSVGTLVPNGKGARYVRSSLAEAPFTISTDVIDVLNAEFHDRTVLRIPENTIRSIAITRLGDTERWARVPRPFQASNWVPEGKQCSSAPSSDEIGRFAESLQNLRTSRYVQYDGKLDASSGLTPSAPVIEIQPTSGRKPQRLRIGLALGDGSVAVTTSETGSGSVFLLPEALIAPLVPSPQLPSDVFERD